MISVFFHMFAELMCAVIGTLMIPSAMLFRRRLIVRSFIVVGATLLFASVLSLLITSTDDVRLHEAGHLAVSRLRADSPSVKEVYVDGNYGHVLSKKPRDVDEKRAAICVALAGLVTDQRLHGASGGLSLEDLLHAIMWSQEVADTTGENAWNVMSQEHELASSLIELHQQEIRQLARRIPRAEKLRGTKLKKLLQASLSN